MAEIRASLTKEQLRERLAGAVAASEKKISEISKISGVHVRDIHRYITDGAEPSALRFIAIIEACEMDVSDIISGEYEKRLDGIADQFDSAVVRVPILDVTASAGPGAWNERAIRLGSLPFSRAFLEKVGVRAETAHCVRASGDSMWPTIGNGALVMVDTGRRVVGDGGIYALIIEGQARLKRVQGQADGSLLLISDNRDLYPAERIDRADRERIEIVGRVFWTEKLL